MRAGRLRLLAGAAAPLILSAAAPGAFVGTYATVKPNEFGIKTVNVSAVFDRPGQDRMIAVAGTPNAPMNIEVLSGSFYQHQFGSDQAPPASLVEVFPSLAFDSFVTIGVKKVGAPGGQPNDALVLAPPWPGFGPSSLSGNNVAWAVTPVEPQGDPFDPVNSFPGDGSVLIGQFSTLDGSAIQGTMLLQFISNGVIVQEPVFFRVGHLQCKDDADCDDGDPCNGQEACDRGDCVTLPFRDCNDNGILDSCDVAKQDCNGNGVPDECDGPDLNNNGVPDDCECLADLDGDGEVGLLDFQRLLTDWGKCR